MQVYLLVLCLDKAMHAAGLEVCSGVLCMKYAGIF